MKYAFCWFSILAAILVIPSKPSHADSLSDSPILFVTMVPNPADFGTLAATFDYSLVSGLAITSRGFAPSIGPTSPSFSIISITRAARL
jgi:hypothetical protein